MIRTPSQRVSPRSGLAPRSTLLLAMVGGGVLGALYLLVNATSSRAADDPRGSRGIESLTPPAEFAATPTPAEPEVELIAPELPSDEPISAPDDATALLDAQQSTALDAALPLDRGRTLKPAIAEAAALPPRVPPGPPLQYSKSGSGSRETINPGRLRIDQYKKQQATQAPGGADSAQKKARRAKRDAQRTGTSGG